MARDHGRILTAIWNDADFIALDVDAQRLYMLLVTQPRLSLCGVLDLTPGRWARLAKNSTPADVEDALERLHAARFVVVDPEAQELLIRTFAKHDGVLSSPNLIQAMWKAWTGVHSQLLRRTIVASLPAKAFEPGFGTSKKDYRPPREALELRSMDGSPNPSANPSPTPETETTPEAEPEATPPVPSQEHSPGLTLVAPDTSPPATDGPRLVFDAWVQAAERTGRTVLTAERRRLIVKQLKHYPLEDLLDAVRGWRHSAHHRGENDRSTTYNDLELLLRDAKHIEMFRDLERDPPSRPVPKGMQGITAWLARTGS